MYRITLLLLATTFSSLVFGQSNYEKFKTFFQANDTAQIKALLIEWEKTKPNDPELYTAAFNYYFAGSKQEILSIQKEPSDGDQFKLTDSSGNTAGFLSSSPGYDAYKLDKAFEYINKGIEKFPNRLDIRFGKCYALGQTGDYDAFTREIINTVEHSNKIKNAWLWTENVKQDDAENFMLGSVQAYMKQLFDTEDDRLLENMIQIGEIVLKYYPRNVEILSTTSVALLLTKKYDRAIAYLKQAEAINPSDYIVLNNIAQAYNMQGDKANAIKYYELTAKNGDERAKEQARQKIEELRR